MARILPPHSPVKVHEIVAFDIALATLDPETRDRVTGLLKVGAAATQVLVSGSGHIDSGSQAEQETVTRALLAQTGVRLGLVNPDSDATRGDLEGHLMGFAKLIGGLTLPNQPR